MIRKILDCARWAPSGGNGQPWEFIVVRHEKTRHEIADIFLKQQEHKREMEMAVRGDAKMTGDGFRHAATSLGLASQYVSDASSPYMETMLKVLLGIPEPLRVYHLIPLGYASKPIPARPRREVEEMIHYERYDMSKYRDDKEFQKFVMTASRRGYYGKRTWVEDDNQSTNRSEGRKP
jgi:nitroreductase